MIRFSLKRILENAPYDLTLSDNNFVFQTDLGIHYMVIGFTRLRPHCGRN